MTSLRCGDGWISFDNGSMAACGSRQISRDMATIKRRLANVDLEELQRLTEASRQALAAARAAKGIRP